MDDRAIRALHALRRAEKEQALFYRALAASAEEEADVGAAERLNGLHADEQHHLSRLSARLLELGQQLEDLRPLQQPKPMFDGWESEAKRREREEIGRYEILLAEPLDQATAALASDALRVERLHEQTLSGKYTGS